MEFEEEADRREGFSGEAVGADEDDEGGLGRRIGEAREEGLEEGEAAGA